MATYSTPPHSGNRPNPLAPVSYTPKTPYVPSAPKADRSKTVRRSASPYRPLDDNNHSHTNTNTAYAGTPAHFHPEEHHYNNNLTINGYASGQLQKPQVDEPRRSFQYSNSNHSSGSVNPPHHHAQTYHTQGQDHSHPANDDIQHDVASLNISSPPRSRLSDGNVSINFPQYPSLPTPGSQQQLQQQQQQVQQAQVQQQYEHQPNPYQQVQNYPFAEGHRYPQPSPSQSSASQLYRTSTGSSTIHTSWSQPSSPGFPPSPYIAHNNSIHDVDDEAYLSEAARLLVDFHPGILSTIAVAFREKMLQNEAKRLDSVNYGLEFPVTFTGKETVDVIIELTKLDDRRHALAIARALEQQQLFFGGGENMVLFDSNNDQYFFFDTTLAYVPGRSEFPTVPTGVFPYSSPCYTYKCLPGGPPCYSYLCPNRQNISAVLGRQNSDVSTISSQEKVWANSVPPGVYAAASKQERNRQEAIFEVIQTEHNYVRDLELMEEIFIAPLRASDIVDPSKRETLIEDVFLNFQEVLALNKRLLQDLRTRQEQQPLVESIGDVLLPHIIGFDQVYTSYIPRIAHSEFAYKREEAQNPKFAQFLKDCTRHPEARRLGLRHFVYQPYQRVPRYPLLLSEVVKRTDDGVADKDIVKEVIRVCSELGKKIDQCMPDANRHLRLLNLQDKIIWKSDSHPDLKLSDRSRKLYFECLVKRRANFDVQMIELRLFIFDQVLLMTKEKRDKQGDKDGMVYQVSKHPIPLELVQVRAEDGKPIPSNGREATPGKKLNNSTKSTSSGHRHSTFMAPTDSVSYRVGFQESKYNSPVTIEHHGKHGGIYTLYMAAADRDQFLEQMEIAQARRQEAVSGSHLFKTVMITHGNANPPLPSSNVVHNPLDGKKVTCSAPYLNVLDGKRRVVIGTEDGVFVGMEDDPFSFRLALREVHVSQVGVLEAYHILLVLSGKVLKAFNLSCLDPNSEKSLQIAQELGKSVQYFTAGTCAGKTLVITMKKKNAGESHFCAYEPLENAVLGNHHRGGFSLPFGKAGKSEWFRAYRKFYVGTDSSQLLMLAKMVCVVCPKGFEILMLDNLDNTQVYPSKKDASFAFLDSRPNSVPVSMFKINSDEFLMCYSEFAFTMTKKGELAKKDLIEWEGEPKSFAMSYPYILAFEPGLIEVRHVVTGALEQIIIGDNIRRLYSNVDLNGNSVIQLYMSDPKKSDVRQVVKLIKAPPPPKSILEPVNYQPKAAYVPQNKAAHLMAPALAPVLSPNISAPGVLSTHAHPPSPHQHFQALPVNNHGNQNGHHHQQLPQHQQFHQVAAPPIPQRPSPRLSHMPLYPSYPVHPYSPSQQAYPQVYIPDDHELNQQQPPQQGQFNNQQFNGQYQGFHATSWSSGGYP
ncbi:RHO1 GDP-GTP exchange protein 2 [Podila horticola]|nr:RHO1 GDP-GTP exchange protein 2 [Podila horticola]